MGIHVEEIGELLDFETALGGFALAAGDCLRQAEEQIRRREARLRDREEHFRLEIARCERLLDCDPDDEPPGVRERLYDLQGRLAGLRGWRSRIEDDLRGYRREAARLERLATRRTERARLWLRTHVEDLQSYLAVEATGGSSGPGGATGLPAGGGFVERGMQLVQVAELPEPEFFHGHPEFKKVPVEQMASNLVELDAMMPEILAGPGQDGEFWRRWDAERGLAFADGRERVFEAFFAGGGAVRVERTAAGYDILSGAEAIWLARRLGLRRLPVSLSEKEVSRGLRT